jgi:hypothetical protein
MKSEPKFLVIAVVLRESKIDYHVHAERLPASLDIIIIGIVFALEIDRVRLTNAWVA